MAEQARALITVDEFLAWEDASDTRYELADGVVTAMSPPSNAHGTIVINVGFELRTLLRDRPECRPQADAGIRISDVTMWQADVGLSCDPIPPGGELKQPRLVVEVLSPSTRTHDLGRKLNDYKTVPSVEEIWLVDSERRWTQVWRREGDGWVGQDFLGAARFPSNVAGAQVGLDELYTGTTL